MSRFQLSHLVTKFRIRAENTQKCPRVDIYKIVTRARSLSLCVESREVEVFNVCNPGVVKIKVPGMRTFIYAEVIYS
jgi:hypothetical protein